MLFLFFVDRVGLRDGIEFFKRKFSVRELLAVLGGVVHVALAQAFFVAYGHEFYESIL